MHWTLWGRGTRHLPSDAGWQGGGGTLSEPWTCRREVERWAQQNHLCWGYSVRKGWGKYHKESSFVGTRWVGMLSVWLVQELSLYLTLESHTRTTLSHFSRSFSLSLSLSLSLLPPSLSPLCNIHVHVLLRPHGIYFISRTTRNPICRYYKVYDIVYIIVKQYKCPLTNGHS